MVQTTFSCRYVAIHLARCAGLRFEDTGGVTCRLKQTSTPFRIQVCPLCPTVANREREKHNMSIILSVIFVLVILFAAWGGYKRGFILSTANLVAIVA